MNDQQRWRVHKYWESLGGLLIEDFIAVGKGKNGEGVVLDSLIILDWPAEVWQNASIHIKGKNVVVIHADEGRLSMNLLGKAYFGKELLLRNKPRSIRSVIICGADDSNLAGLSNKNGVEVLVVSDYFSPGNRKRIVREHERDIQKWISEKQKSFKQPQKEAGLKKTIQQFNPENIVKSVDDYLPRSKFAGNTWLKFKGKTYRYMATQYPHVLIKFLHTRTELIMPDYIYEDLLRLAFKEIEGRSEI